jgi:hypothetical protein
MMKHAAFRILGAALAALVGITAVPGVAAADGKATGRVGASIAKFLREHPDATKVSPYQVAWANGAILTWADPATGAIPTDVENRSELPPGDEVSTLDVNGCPSGSFTTNKYCFYEHTNFGGRMLQFADCGSYQYFSTYGFENQTSSWVNTTGNTVTVYNRLVGGGQAILWVEGPASNSSVVTTANNDKADHFYSKCP